jgi:hypothetical protein
LLVLHSTAKVGNVVESELRLQLNPEVTELLNSNKSGYYAEAALRCRVPQWLVNYVHIPKVQRALDKICLLSPPT